MIRRPPRSTQGVSSAASDVYKRQELGIARWVGVGNKVDTDEARQAIEELCAEHDVPLDVIIPSTSDIVAADRRGDPLDRDVAPDVWEAVESLVDALELDVVPVG